MERTINEPPAWASDEHIYNRETPLYCHHCRANDRGHHELQVVETRRIGSWMGTNWEDGFEELVECPYCEQRGQLTTRLMDKHRNNIRFSRLGAAGPYDPVADGNNNS